MSDPGPAKTKTSATEETTLELRIGAQTDIGRVRDRNEDRVLVFDLKRFRELSAVGTESASLRRPGVLLVVADGMGGMSGGETASQMCVENLLTLFLEKLDTPKDDGTMPDAKDTLCDAVKATNDLIFSRATADMKLKGMGTTLTAALLEENRMCVAQVGDSRAYLLRDGSITKLTKDQTLLASLEERLKNRGHAVIVVAEGAGQKYFKPEDLPRDPSGNVKPGDIGIFLANQIRDHFCAQNVDINLKYIDPSYIIRSMPANYNDRIYCGFLGQNAVHAGLAGKTAMLVSRWHGHYVHVPIKAAVGRSKEVDLDSPLWRSVLESTGQPPLKNICAL